MTSAARRQIISGGAPIIKIGGGAYKLTAAARPAHGSNPDTVLAPVPKILGQRYVDCVGLHSSQILW